MSRDRAAFIGALTVLPEPRTGKKPRLVGCFRRYRRIPKSKLSNKAKFDVVCFKNLQSFCLCRSLDYFRAPGSCIGAGLDTVALHSGIHAER